MKLDSPRTCQVTEHRVLHAISSGLSTPKRSLRRQKPDPKDDDAFLKAAREAVRAAESLKVQAQGSIQKQDERIAQIEAAMQREEEDAARESHEPEDSALQSKAQLDTAEQEVYSCDFCESDFRASHL